MTRGLVVSHQGERCGVYQFGRRLFEMLKISAQIEWRYAECNSLTAFLEEAIAFSPDVVVLNYHPFTLAWAEQPALKLVGVPCLAVFHEACQVAADVLGVGPFDGFLCPDPTLLPRNPIAIPVPRFIPAPRPTPAWKPDIFTLGSFGFASPGKGFERLCQLVNLQFDRARIRLNLPPHDIDALIPQTGTDELIRKCHATLTKPGIKLEVTRDFLGEEALMDFLSENSINAFFYDDGPERGIASCTDYALASGRPIAVSSSRMFRHLHGVNPSIVITERSLLDITASGVEPLREHIAAYSPRAASLAWNGAVLRVLDRGVQSRALPDGRGFNKILDDRSRTAYGQALDDLLSYAPELLSRKIERANVQQAFALDAAERLIPRYHEPRILAVGSFEDTTVAVLRAKGWRLDEVDPNVNAMDLEQFVASPFAVPQSYDAVLCVSVLEHVIDDEGFVRAVADLLAPGGVAIFTLDFSNGFPQTGRKPALDQRLYTTADIRDRLMAQLPDCGLIDPPNWDDGTDEFTYDECNYDFASWVFQKFDAPSLRYALPDLRRLRQATRSNGTSREPARSLTDHGTVHDSMATIIGKEQTERATRIFVADGARAGILAYGPYCFCPPGAYQCSFSIKLTPTDIPGDTMVVMIDTAFDGVAQDQQRFYAYQDLSPGGFSVISHEFFVCEGVSRVETRLWLLVPMEATMTAAVAIRRSDVDGQVSARSANNDRISAELEPSSSWPSDNGEMRLTDDGDRPPVELPATPNIVEGDIDGLVLREFFPDADYKGVMVEIGAARPDFLSIGASFRRLGWRVLSIEPNPEFAALHRALGHEIVQAACGETDADDVSFVVVSSKGARYLGGDVTYESFSSLGIRGEFAALMATVDVDTTEIKVAVRRLDRILAECRPPITNVDVISVDVEGWEMEVVRGLNLRQHGPKVLIIENLSGDRAYEEELSRHSYRLWRRVEPNDVYVREID